MVTEPAKTAATTCHVPAATFDRLAVSVPLAGVVLGRDGAGRVVPLRLFDEQPRTAVFVGGWLVAQILVLRCVAHGAVVEVQAPDVAVPGGIGTLDHWLFLDELIEGRGLIRPAGDPDEARTGTVGSDAVRTGIDRARLLLRDMGPGGGPGGAALLAGRASLTVLNRPTEASIPLLAGADVVMVERLDQSAADVIGPALALSVDVASSIASLDEEMLAVFGDGAARYVWLTPTTVERSLFS
jgi:hypothetical protein